MLEMSSWDKMLKKKIKAPIISQQNQISQNFFKDLNNDIFFQYCGASKYYTMKFEK